MQCSVCGYVMSDLDAECRRCQSLVRSKSLIWPPPVAGLEPARHAAPAAPMHNTSGMQEGAPPEVSALRWNWGAFCNGWLWCWKHNLPVLGWSFFLVAMLRLSAQRLAGPQGLWVESLCTLATLGLSVYVGMSGHRLAWERRQFPEGFPQFIAVQRAWMRWGLGIDIPFLLLCLILVPYLASLKPPQEAGIPSAPPPTSSAGAPPVPATAAAPIVLYRHEPMPQEPMSQMDGRYPPVYYRQRFGLGGPPVPGMFAPRPPGVYIPRGYPIMPGRGPENGLPVPSTFPRRPVPDGGPNATSPSAPQPTPDGPAEAASPSGPVSVGAPDVVPQTPSGGTPAAPSSGYGAPSGTGQTGEYGQSPVPPGNAPTPPGGAVHSRPNGY